MIFNQDLKPEDFEGYFNKSFKIDFEEVQSAGTEALKAFLLKVRTKALVHSRWYEKKHGLGTYKALKFFDAQTTPIEIVKKYLHLAGLFSEARTFKNLVQMPPIIQFSVLSNMEGREFNSMINTVKAPILETKSAPTPEKSRWRAETDSGCLRQRC